MERIAEIVCTVLLFITSIFGEENIIMTKEKPVVAIETTAGTFEVTLFPDVAPKACENFIGFP